MRSIVLSAVICTLLASAAVAQDMPAEKGPVNPAMKSMQQNNSMHPVSGANSFTMGQARSAIEAKGYTKVARLKKDKSGVWRGMAMKDGHSGAVSVDYQGNVN